MASGSEKRRELRKQRMEAEKKAQSSDKRQNMMKLVGIGVFAAIVVVVIAVIVSQTGGDDTSAPEINQKLAGIPQKGTVLGEPDAPVTLVEFGDLQCPACKAYADQIIPEVIDGPVKAGDAKLDFRHWTIIGPESNLAAKAMYAAGEQGKAWQFIENFYLEQGAENSGYVTDDFLRGIAEDAGVPDLDKWEQDRSDPRWNKELRNATRDAVNAGFTGTPSFALLDENGELTPVNDTGSADALISAIQNAQ